jgi:hypothetical protein
VVTMPVQKQHLIRLSWEAVEPDVLCIVPLPLPRGAREAPGRLRYGPNIDGFHRSSFSLWLRGGRRANKGFGHRQPGFRPKPEIVDFCNLNGPNRPPSPSRKVELKGELKQIEALRGGPSSEPSHRSSHSAKTSQCRECRPDWLHGHPAVSSRGTYPDGANLLHFSWLASWTH